MGPSLIVTIMLMMMHYVRNVDPPFSSFPFLSPMQVLLLYHHSKTSKWCSKTHHFILFKTLARGNLQSLWQCGGHLIHWLLLFSAFCFLLSAFCYLLLFLIKNTIQTFIFLFLPLFKGVHFRWFFIPNNQ